jgi:hypothetical protein
VGGEAGAGELNAHEHIFLTLCSILAVMRFGASQAPPPTASGTRRRRRRRNGIVPWGPFFIAVPDTEVLVESHDALVCLIDGRRTWIPRHEILNHDVPRQGRRGLIVIARRAAVAVGVLAAA